jgi:hypothetical protein
VAVKDEGKKGPKKSKAPKDDEAPAPVEAPAGVDAEPPPSRPLPARPERSGPSEADKLNTHAFVAMLVGWVAMLLGQRVLDQEGGAAKALTGLGVVLLLTSFGQRIWAMTASSPDRRASARAFALLSGFSVLALGLYFLSTEAGRDMLGNRPATPDEHDNFGDVVTVSYIAFLVLSILPSIFGEFARRTMLRAERVESGRVLAAVAAGLTITLCAVYGSLFTFVGNKLEVFADFSYFRVAKPSDSTVKMLESMEEPLKVVMFFPPSNEVGKQVHRYLSDLQAISSKVEIEQRDLVRDPGLAKEYKVREDGAVVLVRDKMNQTMKVGVDEKRAAGTLKKLDGEFQKVLIQTLRDKRTAYLTVGHNELNESTDEKSNRTTKALRELLEKQFYGIKNLGLAEGLAREVPTDASIVFVLGPTEPFTDAEIDTLKRFADGGGKLFLALDPEGQTDYAALAAIAGVKWEKAVIVNDDSYARMNMDKTDKKNLIAKSFSSHPSVSTLGKLVARGAAVAMLGSAPLNKLDEADESYRVDFAIKTVAGSYLDLNGNWANDADKEKKATFNVAAAVSRKIDPGAADKDKKKPMMGAASDEMRAWVMGDAEGLADPAIIPVQTNQLLFVEVVRWLGGEESFSGAISEEEDVALVHTKAEDQIWFYAAVVVFPGMVAGGGVWLTRRRRPSAPKKPARAAEGDRPKKATKKKVAGKAPPVTKGGEEDEKKEDEGDES